MVCVLQSVRSKSKPMRTITGTRIISTTTPREATPLDQKDMSACKTTGTRADVAKLLGFLLVCSSRLSALFILERPRGPSCFSRAAGKPIAALLQ